MQPFSTGSALQAALANVQAALAKSDIEGAAALACRALDSGLESPLFLNLRAYRLEREGQLEQALADLRRARELAPRDHAILNSLGLCLARTGRMREAAAAFDSAIALAPDFAPAHFNKGWVSEELADLEEAERRYEAAAALSSHPAEPLGKLAGLAARRANWDLARSLAARALAYDSRNAAATLAIATADLQDGEADRAKQRLSALLARRGLDGLDESRGRAMLGDALDAMDRTTEAFASYAAANEAMRRHYAPRYAGDEPAPQQLARLTRYFEAARREDWAWRAEAAHAPCARHIFIAGFPRSGTTLLEQAIAGHPGAIASGERDPLSAVQIGMSRPDDLDRLARATPDALAAARAAYWKAAARIGGDPAGKIFIDKLPYNILKLPLIARLFPAAPILFSIRDPRDVVLGCFRQLLQMNAFNFEFLTLEGTARLYDATMRLADAYRAKLALDLHEVRHEDLVADFETRMRAVCARAGISWVPEMRRFAERAKTQGIATPSAAQLARGLSRSGIGRWRRYRTELAPVLPILQPWVQRFGYSPD